MRLRAPFAYFGAKGHVAAEVWRRLGPVDHYIEPFMGSAAVLLARPDWRPGLRLVETVNDLDGLLVNAWRSIQWAPDATREAADWPVTELDMHARHRWLCGEREAITERLRADPLWYDSTAAKWWIWGAANWLGSGWGSRPESRQVPKLGSVRTGPDAASCTDFARNAARLRWVKVLAGDWQRVLTPAAVSLYDNTTVGIYSVGVLLDPPYDEGVGYAAGGGVSAAVWAWAVEHGADTRMRIAVCGYEDGRDVPDGWATVEWDTGSSAHGAGYGNHADGAGRANARRERIWFSPGCLAHNAAVQLDLLNASHPDSGAAVCDGAA